MIFTNEQISCFRGISIAGMLASLGYRTQHTAKGMYFSPFRDERTPSFYINDNEHYWIDYGEVDVGTKNGKHHTRHDIFDLLSRLKGYSFGQSLQFLSGWSPTADVDEVIKASRSTLSNPIVVTDVSHSLTNRTLLDYAANSRCISRNILNRYCFQVEYNVDYVDRKTGEVKTGSFRAIGFPNRNGGWVLRNAERKLSSAAGFTFVRSDGSFDNSDDMPPSAGTVVLFEGFFDFLSWLNGQKREVPIDADVIILNSVNNIDRALDVVLRYPKVECFLDNDHAGDVCTQKVADAVAEVSHVCTDRRPVFAGFNDVNEMWISECEKFNQRSVQQSQVSESPVAEKAAGRSVR